MTDGYGPETVPAEFTGIRPVRWLSTRHGTDGRTYLEFASPSDRGREPVKLMPTAEIVVLWALLLVAGFLIEFVRQAVTR